MENSHLHHFNTRAVHAGEHVPQGDFIPVSTPIVPTVGFQYNRLNDLDAIFAGEREGYVYPRYGSPTVSAFESAVANLEGGQAALALSSGMAALHLALLAAGVRAGGSVVGALDLYGATYTMLRGLFVELGVEVELIDVSNLDEVEKTLERMKPAALLVETISNPLLKVADIPALADLAQRAGTQFLVDNTFATPCLFNPLSFGASFCIHSATKYIGGHGDVMGGVVVTTSQNRQQLFELNKMIGSVLGPFEAWLALRGLKTLPLRYNQQCANAAYIARWLSNHPKIGRVIYPGLPDHPQYNLAQRLFSGSGFGGMLSFELVGDGQPEVFRFLEKLTLILPVTTLGDIYTLALHPASTSHRGLTKVEREQVGITDTLVRISAGIEDPEDLIADLEQALA
jgi:cystathionine beta-lyase/cystathionine gamma-synthase